MPLQASTKSTTNSQLFVRNIDVQRREAEKGQINPTKSKTEFGRTDTDRTSGPENRNSTSERFRKTLRVGRVRKPEVGHQGGLPSDRNDEQDEIKDRPRTRGGPRDTRHQRRSQRHQKSSSHDW